MFKIRHATSQDISDLTILFNSDTNVFGENNIGFEERDIQEYIHDNKKKIFICMSGDKIVGALMADYHETYSHLETLIVEKTFQQSGVGSALLDYYEEDLQKLNIPLIEVLTKDDNTIMQKILASRGYRKGNSFVFYSKG